MIDIDAELQALQRQVEALDVHFAQNFNQYLPSAMPSPRARHAAGDQSYDEHRGQTRTAGRPAARGY